MRDRWMHAVALALALALPAAASAQGTQPPSDPGQASPAPTPGSPAAAAPAAQPLDDPTVPLAGELEPPLDVIDRDPSNWLGIAPEDEWLNFLRDPLRELDERRGIAFTGAYTVLFQQSVGPGHKATAAGDFDLSLRWTPIGRGTKDTGSFYFNAEYRHDFGDLPTPSTLGGRIGTLLGTTNGFDKRGWAVKDAYYVQRLFEDRLRLGLGRVDAENLVGNHLLQSVNTSFLNRAFSKNSTIAFPGSGMGAAASVRPVDWFYLAGGATNAYGSTTSVTADLLDEWQLFEFAEIGFTPTIEDVGQARFRVAYWRIDERERTGQPSDDGFSVIYDQTIGERITLFARYGYAGGDATGLHQSAQAGGAVSGLFGSPDDLTGLAFGWSEPLASLPDEKVLELFHRFQISGRFQLTLGVQLILDPSNAPEVSALEVFSARFRVSF
jgi:porin